MISDSINLVKQNYLDVVKRKKKRGKYVEKRSSKLSNYSKASSRACTLAKSPVISPKARSSIRSPSNVPRRPPVNSFVNILSKPQRHDNNYETREYYFNMDLKNVSKDPKKQKENKMSNRNRKLENSLEKSPVSNSPEKKLKKGMNVEKNRPTSRKYPEDGEPDKELDLIPSACSSLSLDGLSWMSYSDDEEIFINKEITDPLSNIDYENNQVVKEINEGKKINEEKSKHETPYSEKSQDKAIYNFFVDVLHTIKPDCQIQINKPIELKDSTEELKNLKIDEKVAKKLAFTQQTNKKVNIYGLEDGLSDSPVEHFDIVNLMPERPIISHEPMALRNKPKVLAHRKPKSKSVPQSSSFRKTLGPKKSKKKRFLAMMKKQLTLNIHQDYYEEPRSLYEALKIMAKNKTPTPQVRFQESKNTCKRDVKPRKTRKFKKNLYDVRYPIEAEVDSRYLYNLYSPKDSLRSLQVYGENYLYKNQEEYDSNTTDMCNRFSIASFFGVQSSNLKARSSPIRVTRKTVGNRSLSPFSLRSFKLST